MLNLMKILVTMNDHDRDIPFDHHDEDHRDDSDHCEEGEDTHLHHLPLEWERSLDYRMQENPKCPHVCRSTIVALVPVHLRSHISRCSTFSKQECARCQHTWKPEVGYLEGTEVIVHDVLELLGGGGRGKQTKITSKCGRYKVCIFRKESYTWFTQLVSPFLYKAHSLFTLYHMKCNHQKGHITWTVNKRTTRSHGLRTLGETNTTLNVLTTMLLIACTLST